MTVESVTIDLPEEVYQRVRQAAAALRRPVSEILEQTIRGNLPPLLTDLPEDMQEELALLQNAESATLWQIAQESLPPDQWKRHQQLLHAQQMGRLSPQEADELEDLRTKTDQYVLRRSYALALLKWRGHLPSQPPAPTD